MTNKTRLLVVCGLHRSGTTFVGEILRQSGIYVVHEPLNECFGMVGVPIAYPFVERCGDQFSVLLDDALQLARPWNKDISYIQSSGVKRSIYALTGGRSGLRWEWLRLCSMLGMSPRCLCLKDPFMTLSTPYLVREHGLNVVCMVRHPAAIHYSTDKQGWRFDVDNLLQQPELIARHGADIPKAHWDLARESAAASIALLWKMMMRVNGPLAERDSRMLMVRHEELCLEPQKTVRKICEHFGIPFTPILEGFVSENSEGDQAESKDGKTHDFRRNSRALIDTWRGKVSEDKVALMREIIGEDLRLFIHHGKSAEDVTFGCDAPQFVA